MMSIWLIILLMLLGAILSKKPKDTECKTIMMTKVKIQWARKKREKRKNLLFLSLSMNQISNHFEKKTTILV